MVRTPQTLDVERALLRETGLRLVVEEDDGVLVVTGMVESEGERQAALDVARALAPLREVVDDITVMVAMPEYVAALHVASEDVGAFSGGSPGLEEEVFEPGDFAGPEGTTDPFEASGSAMSSQDADRGSHGDLAYAPPVDPVGTSRRVIGGFEITSMDEEPPVERSTIDGIIDDDAIAGAVHRELAEDAATAGLTIDVAVRHGVVHLLGRVPTLDDAENAEEVAWRVEGVQAVTEKLDVDAGRIR